MCKRERERERDSSHFKKNMKKIDHFSIDHDRVSKHGGRDNAGGSHHHQIGMYSILSQMSMLKN